MSTSKLEAIHVDGAVIWVEASDLDLPAAEGAGTSFKTAKTEAGSGTARATEDLVKVDLNKTLAAIVKPVHDVLKASAPEEVSLELQLGLKGEVGFFVAKSEGNASLKITAKWKFDKPAAG